MTLSKKDSLEIRKEILKYSIGKRVHIGSMFSLVEILLYLFYEKMLIEEDSFILSKGHAALLEYIIMNNLNRFSSNENLQKYGSLSSNLGTHPETTTSFIEVPTGSLGNGLGIAIGRAIYQKYYSKGSRIYVVLGDGELNEGAIWEGFQQAPRFELSNLFVIIDNNKLQMVRASAINNGKNYKTIFELLGWDVEIVDGHSFNSINRGIEKLENSEKPKILIANTIKGKGIKEFEGNNIWHNNLISSSEYRKFAKELDNAFE